MLHDSEYKMRLTPKWKLYAPKPYCPNTQHLEHWFLEKMHARSLHHKNNKKQTARFQRLSTKGSIQIFFDLVILNVIWNHVDVETLPLTHFTHPSQAFTWDYGFFQQRTRNDLNWWTTNSCGLDCLMYAPLGLSQRKASGVPAESPMLSAAPLPPEVLGSIHCQVSLTLSSSPCVF